MAIMYPKNISEYMPTDSERIVYQELKNQLPDSFDVFYSVNWTSYENGRLTKSESDFVVVSPDYGFLCLEVKGGSGIRVEDNVWYVEDATHGDRRLSISPYDQAEKSMYFFSRSFSNKYNMKYQGIFGAAVVFPFYPVGDDVELDNRDRTCTIDSNDLNQLYSKIKKIYRLWGGSSYGRRFYPKSQNDAFLELVRERIAISAAAGALVKYKEQQLDVINRVQDNYIYFLSNIRQFFIRGGAGTGKTWIAMKMAKKEAQNNNGHVLFLCTSSKLASEIKRQIGNEVEVKDVISFFREVTHDFDTLQAPLYQGILNLLNPEIRRYDAIFVDEAQDFSSEWAQVIKKVLVNPETSRLGVFYDDVQVLRKDSFDNGFGIKEPPYLLHENIRNTANIYNWTSEKTNLGRDMIANPVEGPTPITEVISDRGQLTLVLESMFRKYLDDEYLPNSSLVIVTDDPGWLMESYPDGIAKWRFSNGAATNANEISVYSVAEFKGLESDMIIYLHSNTSSTNEDYIAYTRAKYYLIEIVREG